MLGDLFTLLCARAAMFAVASVQAVTAQQHLLCDHCCSLDHTQLTPPGTFDFRYHSRLTDPQFG